MRPATWISVLFPHADNEIGTYFTGCKDEIAGDLILVKGGIATQRSSQYSATTSSGIRSGPRRIAAAFVVAAVRVEARPNLSRGEV